jgi:uncharacterized protein (DUF1330 family)
MGAMPAYVVVEIEITDPETYGRYVQQVQPSLDAYGGRFVVRGGQAETLEGDWSPKRIVIAQFDSAEKAREWWASDIYAGPKKLRQSSSRTNMILVEGVAAAL